jgi:tight adherence protein C
MVEAAGWDAPVERIVGWKVLVAVTGGLLGASLSPLRIVSPILAVVGFLAPDIWAGRAAKARRRMADAEVPAFLDLLAAGSMAGLAAPLALQRAANGVGGPLAHELQGAAAAVALGGRWGDELREIADRVGLPDLRRAVTAITRTEVLGSSLADTIRELADDVREDRRNGAAEEARKAPVKMLFPLVFMILPAFLLLTVVPVLLSTLRSIR